MPVCLVFVWLGFTLGEPFPFIFELLFVAAIGIIPVFLMQLMRPFDIFSILILALKPEAMTREQRQILSLFKTKAQHLLTLIAAVTMLVVLWQIYGVATSATIEVTFLPQWRIFGLLLAAIAFAASNLFWQVPLSVLGVLFIGEEKFVATEPYDPENIEQDFTIPGFRVNTIIPQRTSKSTSKMTE